MKFDIRPAGQCDLPAILDIVNDAILNSTAWYDDQPRSLADKEAWLSAKSDKGWPVFVAATAEGVHGFATMDIFRHRPAYGRTAEHSVYVARASRGKGVGRALLGALIEEAERRQLHVLVGGVDSENTGSLAFHESMGFSEVGRLPEVGWKFGRWLTLIFMHRIIKAPNSP